MKNFKGAVAVITGGASGLGLAMAREAQARGCYLVIADIRQDALDSAVAELSAKGEVLGVLTDVSKAAEIEALAEAAVARFGKVNLLVNNAGVFASGLAWETSAEEFDWVIGVNQRSVVNGIRSFVPRMIAQGDECHVLTISSGAGITVNPGFASYSMTKHAVLALSEALWLDLRTQKISSIGVTIAMPGMTQSGIMNPEKTTPQDLQGEVATRMDNPVLKGLELMMQAGVAGGLSAAALATQVFSEIEQGELYVLPAFDDPDNRAVATAIGTGRATGVNAYPAINDAFMAAIEAMPTA